jgi:hypothetical protein
VAPFVRQGICDLDEWLINANRDRRPLDSGKHLRVFGMHEHLQRGERAALCGVDDRDGRSVPAAGVLRGAATIERTGEA